MSWGDGPSQISPPWFDRWTRPDGNADTSAPVWGPYSHNAQYEEVDSSVDTVGTETYVDTHMSAPAQGPPANYDHAPVNYVPIDEPPPTHAGAHSHEGVHNRPSSDHGERPEVGQPPVHDFTVSHNPSNHDAPHHSQPEDDSQAHPIVHEDYFHTENSTSQDSDGSHYPETRPGHSPHLSEDHSVSHDTAHEQHTSRPTVHHNITTSTHTVAHHGVEYFPQGRLPDDYDPQAYNTSERMDMTDFDMSSLPNPVPERAPTHLRYLTVITMLRNQRRWLREWIEYYLMMGVEHFIIYDNNSEDEPLDILQCYIDQGLVTYVLWPPKSIPGPWRPFKTRLEAWQYHWFHDSLDTCLDDTWTIHRQAPCQLAAFSDALTRTRGGVTRWLASLDVDEYIYPRPNSGYESIAELLRREHSNTDHVIVYGNVFGTSGHIDHAARRKPGEPLQALMTENYIYRAELEHTEYPWSNLGVDNWEVHGKGLLGGYRFGGGDDYIRKSFADPDLAGDCWIHIFHPPDNRANWNEVTVWVMDQNWKFNHYAYLSQADARRKAESNRNPYMNYSSQVDAFFSRVHDTEIHYYLPELKMRMMHGIQDCPSSPRPDDWVMPTRHDTN